MEARRAARQMGRREGGQECRKTEGGKERREEYKKAGDHEGMRALG